MITFTKEQLIASAHARIEFAEMMLAGELEPLKERTWSIELELARIALTSLEAEAVGEVVLGEYDDCGCHPDARVACIAADCQADWENFKDGTRLYTAPPAPVSMKDHQIRELVNELRDIAVEYHGTQQLRERIARTVRAAMLQRGENSESPTTLNTATALDSLPKIAESTSGNSPVIPDWQAQAEKRAELYGSSFVLFRNGESPQCADPTKVIISFTDEGLGHGSAAPQPEV
ncbi:hypothetical protein AALM51_10235 [Enterobacter roggenkampii]|uniref:hypothetical protein n=1 Tax=Enterobacter roggenkampii TaxID=1812935 RepID=UPI003512FBFD